MDLQALIDSYGTLGAVVLFIAFQTFQLRKAEAQIKTDQEEANVNRDNFVTRLAEKQTDDKDELQTKYEALLSTSSKKEGTIETLEKQIIGFQGELKKETEARIKLEQTVDMLKENRERDKARIEDIITERDTARTERDESRAERDKEKAKVVDLQSQVARQAQSMSALNRTNEQLQATINEQKITIATLQTHISEQDKNIITLTERVTLLEKAS